MYGQIIGAAVSAAGGIVSSLIAQKQAAEENKRANEQLDKSQRQLDRWYWNTKGDKTERADIKELGRMVQDSVRERNNIAANPIAQNTAEGQAAARAQNSADVASFARTTTSQLAGEDAKNDLTKLEGDKAITQKRIDFSREKAQQIDKAGSQLANSMINMTGKFVGGIGGGGNGGGVSAKEAANASSNVTGELAMIDEKSDDYAPFQWLS